jgi:phosphomannomutase
MKISVSGLRGIYGSDLNLYEICNYAELFGSRLLDQGRKCVLGRDTRPSSHIISRVFESTIMKQGIDILNIGISPTPVVFREARKSHGGCMITASHNPLDWNGLKFIIDGRGFYEKELTEMLERSVQQSSSGYGCSVNSISTYTDELLELVADMQIKNDKKIGIDPGGGAACIYSNIVFRSLGYKIASINDTLSIHPRSPDPTVDDLKELQALVRSSSLDLGFALDLDGDRLVVMDKTGKKLSSDLTLLLCISSAMKLGMRKFVLSVDTSSVVKEFILRHGGQVHFSKVGEANVVMEMAEEGADAGGEGSSAGFILPKFNKCRDGLLAGVLISSLDNESINECTELSSKYHQIRSKLAVDSSLHKALIERLFDIFTPNSTSTIKIDGIKLVIDENSWVLIRSSNTEHAIRISVESTSDKAGALFKDILTKTKMVFDEIR